MVKIQGTRGGVQVPGGQNLQNDFYNLQNQVLPKQDGWIISTAPCITQLTSVDLLSVFQLFYIGTLSKFVTAKFARLYINTADAGKTLTGALYWYTKGSNPSFYMVPGSKVTFDLSSTGLLEVSSEYTFVASPNVEYFFGFVNTSSKLNAYVSGIDLATTPHPISVLYNAATTLPENVILSTLLKGSDICIPYVVYLSQDAQRVL